MMSPLGKIYRGIDGKIQQYTTQSNNMNPFDRWYNSNEGLRNFINEYIKDNIDYLDKYSELKKDCTEIYNNGGIIEKTQAMTLIQFVKRIEEI